MKILKSIAFMMAVLILFLTLPCLWGLQPYVVLSSSLKPEIPAGSVIYVDVRENVEEAHTVYVQEGELEKSEKSQDQILGVWKYTIPYLGYLIKILDFPFMCFWTVCAGLLCKYCFLPWYWAHQKKGGVFSRKKNYGFRKVLQFWGLLFPKKKL